MCVKRSFFVVAIRAWRRLSHHHLHGTAAVAVVHDVDAMRQLDGGIVLDHGQMAHQLAGGVVDGHAARSCHIDCSTIHAHIHSIVDNITDCCVSLRSLGKINDIVSWHGSFGHERGSATGCRCEHYHTMQVVAFALGKRRGYTEPVYQVEQVQRIAKPDTAFVDVPIENISFNVNIYFIINRSDIRTNQMQKLSRLIAYLDKHPKAFVRLSGYADRDTGTPEINMRLSRERSAVVSKFLQEAGIQGWRIRSFAKGDRVQPFDKPQDNRVCICYVYDPDHPERIDNWY